MIELVLINFKWVGCDASTYSTPCTEAACFLRRRCAAAEMNRNGKNPRRSAGPGKDCARARLARDKKRRSIAGALATGWIESKKQDWMGRHSFILISNGVGRTFRVLSSRVQWLGRLVQAPDFEPFLQVSSLFIPKPEFLVFEACPFHKTCSYTTLLPKIIIKKDHIPSSR